MSRIQSRIDVRGEQFQRQDKANRDLRDQLQQRLHQVELGGGEGPRAKHLARGKRLPRERIERLLDAGSPFLEIAPLAAWGRKRRA